MKAALLNAPRALELGEVERVRPATGEVLIEPIRAGICGSDVSFYVGHRTGRYPMTLGHEVVGRVVAVGEAVNNFSVGQRVVVEPNYPCGSCDLCRAGRGSICAAKVSMGVSVPGCFAEAVSAPAQFVWAVPETISDEDAASIEPQAVSVHALRQSGAQAGSAVAVVGCGVIGLLLVHAAVEQGVRVFATDPFEAKTTRARELGAVPVRASDAATVWSDAHVTTVFECAGAAAGVEMVLESAPRGATAMLLGLSSTPAKFSPFRLVREGIRIEPSLIYDHPQDFARTIELVARGELRPSRIVSDTFAFGQIAEALELAATGRAGKVQLSFS